jgi:dephospho-CoA kinase
MILVGLTGIIGSGKSTVATLLRQRGLFVMDLDALARDSLNWKDTQEKIVEAFGDEYLVDGRVDVEKLRLKAFSDRGIKEELESIIHPKVEEKVQATLERLREQDVRAVVIDHPLLFEVGFRTKIDRIVVVTAHMDIVRERLKKRGMDGDDIERRISFQIPLEEKERLADLVIDNNGTEDHLGRQIDVLLEKITKWEEGRTCI